MPRISQLPSLTSPDAADEIAIVDASAATTKKITRNDFLKGAALPADTVTTAAIDDGAVTADKLDFTTLMTNPKFVQTGSFTIDAIASGSGGGTVTVTFPTSFDNSPRVFLQIYNAGANLIEAHASGISTTGFTAIARSGGSAQNSQPCAWIAVDVTRLGIKGV